MTSFQTVNIKYPPTPGGPELMTVLDENGNLPLTLVIDPGHWTITVQSESDMLLVSQHHEA